MPDGTNKTSSGAERWLPAPPSGPPSKGSGWLSLAGTHLGRGRPAGRPAFLAGWRETLDLWGAALRAGGFGLWRSAERRRRMLFAGPRRLGDWVAVSYDRPPAVWHEELARLRGLGVRQVVLPLEQAGSEIVREKTLAAVQNLRAEGCGVAVVLRPDTSRPDPECWRAFCQRTLSQAGWQVEVVQVGALADEMTGPGLPPGGSPMCAAALRLRHDFPGIAWAAPGVWRLDSRREVRRLQQLLPDGAWSWLTLRVPGPEGTGAALGDVQFVQRLLLAGAVASWAPSFGGRVQLVHAVPRTAGVTEADERAACLLARRLVLAAASGMAERVTVAVGPGLVDGPWRVALGQTIRRLEGARFLRRIRTPDPRRDFLLEFASADRRALLVGWTDGAPRQVDAPCAVDAGVDFLGRTVPLLPHHRVRLTSGGAFFEAGGPEGRA